MTKEIQLRGKHGQGKVALVDDADFDELNKYKWYVDSHGYAVRFTDRLLYGGKRVKMHKTILVVAPKHDVDHINGNRLDNRGDNLREVTRSQNNQNNKPRKGTLSQYKGVSFHKASNLWFAEICLNGQRKRIGYFRNERDAAIAYNEAAIKLFGEFARPNIIKDY